MCCCEIESSSTNIQKYNKIANKISSILHFCLVILMLLWLHIVVYSSFDSKLSIMKPVQKMLCSSTLLSWNILELSHHDIRMFKPSHEERTHNSCHQLHVWLRLQTVLSQPVNEWPFFILLQLNCLTPPCHGNEDSHEWDSHEWDFPHDIHKSQRMIQ